jgi:hypothetical protein
MKKEIFEQKITKETKKGAKAQRHKAGNRKGVG